MEGRKERKTGEGRVKKGGRRRSSPTQ
jgi:hypothetical protein